MAEQWLVRVYNDQVLSMFEVCTSPLELGRQHDRATERLFQVTPRQEGGSRIAIAGVDEFKISRKTALLEPVMSDQILVRNLSAAVSLGLDDGSQIKPGQHQVAEIPVVLKFGSKVVQIQLAGPQASAPRAVQTLELATEFHFRGDDRGSSFSELDLHTIAPPDVAGIIDWLRGTIQVLQSAASDVNFFEKGARAAVEVVRLDLGRVLTREEGRWTTAAFYSASHADHQRNSPPSQLVVSRVCEEKKACWFDPNQIDENRASLAGVSSVVAAPVLNRSGEVIAILYGERRSQPLSLAVRPISRLDAMLIEVLAVGLAAGLARVEQEHAALAQRAQFEQFFTPELARVLAAQPTLLDGKDLEITVLFVDIRGFSRITRNQHPAFSVEWTQDVLSTLSECILAHQGVLVDYIGDEVVAMWGAPDEQPDHADRACRAALDMIGTLKELNARWEVKLGEPIAVGIGINTGLARVGNTGSRRKFKYGPLGDTVNVASRVEGASKYFKASLVITRATRDRLGPGFAFRRLGAARVVNIADPIELFELYAANQPDAAELGPAYEEALAAFEAREFRKATGILGRIVHTHPDDGPSFALLARAITCIVDEPENFDPAFRLKGK